MSRSQKQAVCDVAVDIYVVRLVHLKDGGWAKTCESAGPTGANSFEKEFWQETAAD